jgi:hypothetical protein
VKYYENERVQSSTKPETKAQMLLRKDECLGTLLEPSNINDDPRDQSLTDGLGRPDTDWEETATRTQSPWLVNVEPEGCQGKVSGYFQSLTPYLHLGPLPEDSTELANCNYSLLAEKHHIRSVIRPTNFCCMTSQMVLS